jgi:hypothetical protein
MDRLLLRHPGTHFPLVIAPQKGTIYPEFMPSYARPRGDQIRRRLFLMLCAQEQTFWRAAKALGQLYYRSTCAGSMPRSLRLIIRLRCAEGSGVRDADGACCPSPAIHELYIADFGGTDDKGCDISCRLLLGRYFDREAGTYVRQL